MNKKVAILILAFSFLFLPKFVDAFVPSYYESDSNRYVLCKDEDSRNCFEVRKSDKGLIIDSVNSQLSYQGITYLYSSDLQYAYDNSLKEEVLPTTNYCTKLKEPLKFIGRIVLVVKILLPIIIIAYGIFDFFRAVTAAKDDEIKKSARSLLFRLVAGIVIFLIPTIVSVVFSMVSDWTKISGDFNACQKCIFRVSDCQ